MECVSAATRKRASSLFIALVFCTAAAQAQTVRLAAGVQPRKTITLRNEARMQGRPAPSDSIIRLPALASEQAKTLGYACVGEQAFKRLKNGWEQVSSGDGGWQRC